MDIEKTFALLNETEPLKISTSREITVAVMGAGSRGNEYPEYGKLFPGTLRVVAVSDILKSRREAMAEKWSIPADRVFGDYREMLEAGRGGKLADILLIALPDDLHYEPAMEAMRQGYDILLEKPMAQSEKECRDLARRQRETGVMVAVGHVLRYSPYFRALKKAIDSGLVGELVNIQHQEPVMYAHMAHSFVRGNWHDGKATTPMIVAKSCHDLDILKWLAGRRCVRVSAEGGIALFRADKAPAGAPERCTDGCPHEKDCPYSAIDIYERKRWFLYVFDLKRDCPAEEILERLRTTDYGRCAYRMDNDQPDHIVVTLLFEGGVTASFSLDAFTPWGGRRTRVMGTEGYIEGDGKTFTLHRFRTGEAREWSYAPPEGGNYRDSGHAGGDLALIRDFLRAVDTRDFSLLSSSIEASVESHVMGFACERSRLSGTKEDV
ncbi:MAG: Gfo/Idh/MocA family oxidoreductase [Kiritimatiellae bacterium]|nr:Gfo/Idh/MocA family oxidoreductase [Kiritimatiellia bacterium]